MRFLYSVAILLLSACGPKHVQFEPTGSPCLDSISANFNYSKCTSVIREVDHQGNISLTCFDPKITSPWTENTFVIIDPNIADPEQLITGMPVCIDDSIFVYYVPHRR